MSRSPEGPKGSLDMSNVISGYPKLYDFKINCRRWRAREDDLQSSLILGPMSISLKQAHEVNKYILKRNLRRSSKHYGNPSSFTAQLGGLTKSLGFSSPCVPSTCKLNPPPPVLVRKVYFYALRHKNLAAEDNLLQRTDSMYPSLPHVQKRVYSS